MTAHKRIFVRPAVEGNKVPFPTKQRRYLKQHGEWVPLNSYWERRLRPPGRNPRPDVVECDPDEAAKLASAERAEKREKAQAEAKAKAKAEKAKAKADTKASSSKEE